MKKNAFYVDVKALHPLVTGSCFICTVRFPNGEVKKFNLDLGLFQEEGLNELNKKIEFDPKQLSFSICTHTHIDHCGRLPMLIKEGFTNKIYMSSIGSVLLHPALENTFSILSSESDPIFDEEDLDKTFSLIEPKEFYQGFNPCKGIRVTFYKNAHVLGAAIVVFHIYYKGYPPIYLVFSGDYNKKNTFFTTRKLPNSLLEKPVTLITESTYGSTESLEVVESFEKNIAKATSKGYTTIIPVFAFERAQLIMLKLKQMQNSGKLNVNIPIYLDGSLAQKNTKIYQDFSHTFLSDSKEFLPDNLHFVSSQEERIALMTMSNQKIILTTSGMGSFGPAKIYLPYFAQKKKVLIQFTGYLSHCSLGYQLLQAEMGEEITLCDGSKFTKKAIVKQTGEFSSHAKADELIEFANKFTRLQTLLINHGEKNTKNSFKEQALDETNAKHISILSKNLVHRIGPYGLIKTFYET